MMWVPHPPSLLFACVMAPPPPLHTGKTRPNPMVGCVIVNDDGEVVGEGFHPKAGQPHAEVWAIRQAGEKARGATAYVSLEPCNHFGRTPPCVNALLEAGVRKVVAGMVDPFPLVGGKGLERLKENGVEVEVGCEEERCRELNKAFIHRVLHKGVYGYLHLLYKSGVFQQDSKTNLLQLAAGEKYYEECDAFVVEGAEGVQALEDDDHLTDTIVRVVIAEEGLSSLSLSSKLWEPKPGVAVVVLTR